MEKELSQKFDEIILEPPRNWWNLRIGELWEFRELLFFLVWRDIKVRYKQTLLGASWAILQPLFTMVIFSIIFGRFAKLPTDGIPYPIFSYTALLPWQLFSKALSDASSSLVSNQQFITKTYFPRLFLPAASILSGIVDFLVAFIILVLMMVYYKIPFTTKILILPLLLLFTVIICMAVAMWLSAINVKYRDVKYALPFLVQVWLYATPIAYSISLIPKEWQLLYGLNPMVGVIEGFRWALLGGQSDIGLLIGISVLIMIPLFVGGLIYFQRMELTFSDII